MYGNGKVLATYDSVGTYFILTDWLGTKRELVSVTALSTVMVGERWRSSWQALALPAQLASSID
ncbi:MAG TPA: hypothetical protein VHX63_13330 [Acidobacteriaceae bacterium]|nr:hypothetical protein [Acidobacteriaceae bacterium]